MAAIHPSQHPWTGEDWEAQAHRKISLFPVCSVILMVALKTCMFQVLPTVLLEMSGHWTAILEKLLRRPDLHLNERRCDQTQALMSPVNLDINLYNPP